MCSVSSDSVIVKVVKPEDISAVDKLLRLPAELRSATGTCDPIAMCLVFAGWLSCLGARLGYLKSTRVSISCMTKTKVDYDGWRIEWGIYCYKNPKWLVWVIFC